MSCGSVGAVRAFRLPSRPRVFMILGTSTGLGFRV